MINKIEILIIEKIYKVFLSPFVGNSCNYYPTCSTYGVHALSKYGFIKANLKIVYRIFRCNPFFQGGYDPA
ncbi:MAG: membrane protein insertion efficiency factor YidD [Candidatus Cloacimonetes bacterium]|nr:membrane protein insertion efficiency factor YidD [Candidatus Cloacimonadota bacterium]